MTSRPEVNAERLWASVDEMARIGATPEGGVRRLALSPADVDARALLARWLDDLGLETRRDRVGNMFARRPGEDPARRPVLIGSHLDSQPTGGRFDGSLGVLAALELLRALADGEVRTEAPIELVNWTDEEGARFDRSCVGSSVYAGTASLRETLALRDADGVTLEQALESAGQVGAPEVEPAEADSYFELHIEQGQVLERAGAEIGAVGAIQAVRWVQLELRGAETHAGTTAMDDRRDALLAAARVIEAIDEVAREHGPAARGAACQLTVAPNAGSVIAGGARILADLRHPDTAVVEDMDREVRERAAEICDDAGLACAVTPRWIQHALTFDPGCIELVRAGAARRGYSSLDIVSGAGHDAGYVSLVAPAAMVFIPCRDGVSHHPAEHVEPEHAKAGTEVLLDAVLDRADMVAAR